MLLPLLNTYSVMSVINLDFNESKLGAKWNAGSRVPILITQREIEFSPTSSSRNTPEFSMQINVSMLCYCSQTIVHF